MPLASHQTISYMIPEKAQIAAPVFPEEPKDNAMQLTGIHHLTAVSAKPRDNLAFYTGLLGMRLVKKTVNQDNVSAYHLFYADGKANPGTDLTFFDFRLRPSGVEPIRSRAPACASPAKRRSASGATA